MLGFLKVFARGIICTILLPFILLIWVLYGVYCLVMFFVVLVKSIILFFAGENAAGDLKEDIEAKRILLEKEQSQVEQAQVMNMMYQNMAAQQQMFNQQMMQQQAMPQQPVMPTQPVQPQPTAQQQNDFDPFTPDSEEQSEPFKDNNLNEEGGNNNDQSY